MLMDPYAVFAAAQHRWLAAVYPAHVRYGVAVSVSKNGVTSAAHYHAVYDSAQNRVTLNAVSDEEIAHPYTPHGINVFFNAFGGRIPMSSPQHTFDYLGVPMLAPNYSFGIVASGPVNTTESDAQLVREVRAQFHDPEPPREQQAPGKDLKTIAEVAVAHRRYIIRLAGTQPLAGHSDYHLVLQPVSQPSTYRLREMWVDTRTYATDRIVTDGNFTAGGLTKVRWRTDFVQVGGAPFIASESALTAFTLDRRSYDGAVVAFSDISVVDAGTPYSTLPRFETSTDTAPPVLSEPDKPRV